jgi:hypothetical protein
MRWNSAGDGPIQSTTTSPSPADNAGAERHWPLASTSSTRSAKLTRYLFFLALEVTGMGLILWDGLPIYQRLFDLQRVATTDDRHILLIAVFAIQISYWHTLRHGPPFEFSCRPFAAHVLLFVSRLSFVFASSLFALVAYRYSSILSFNPLNVSLLVAILFSVFCFSRHLEAIGLLLLNGSKAD